MAGTFTERSANIDQIHSSKSTTTDHSLYKCGGINKDIIKKFEKEIQRSRKNSFKHAQIINKLKPKCMRGIISDINF